MNTFLISTSVVYTPAVRLLRWASLFLAALTAAVTFGKSDDTKTAKKAAEASTLNQPGTKPFHLKAVVAPTLKSQGASKRTANIEIWWDSPSRWRREVRSPDFHQIEIVNGSEEWQKNERSYFPEWLREVAIALIDPIPNLDQTLEQIKGADTRGLPGSSSFSWAMPSTDGTVTKTMGCAVVITANTGLLSYAGCLGWNGGYSDYSNFHGRKVARTVTSGSPEVTAKVTLLEDLPAVPSDFFDTKTPGGDSHLLRTVVVDELSLRKNLLPMDPPAWPKLKDGPLQGAITTDVVVDTAGNVQELGSILSDNQGLSETAGKWISSMHFKPYMENGAPVQVVSRITMAFKTVRPEGSENFESARTYFERGRIAGFPAAGQGPSYVLHAVVHLKGRDAQYTDTWKNATEWRREATIGKSRFVRAQHGEKHYRLEEGPDARLLALVLKTMEPIPAIDTFWEGDWRMKRDLVDGVSTVRVLTGYEDPKDGSFDPEHVRAYWFDANGTLRKAYFMGLESRRLDFRTFNGAQVAQRIELRKDGALAMVITLTDLSTTGDFPDKTFQLGGHEWKRAFTDEVR